MMMKPVFESACKASDNENLKFCAVNVQFQRECGQYFDIRPIPQFHFFLNGSLHTKFVGADKNKLFQALAELD